MLVSFDGRLLLQLEGRLDEPSKVIQSQFSGLPGGVYLLQIRDGEAHENFRLVRN